jgi:pyruvate,orthophosphate dikinase
MTSHAAVVARGMGAPCVSGCHEIEVDNAKETLTLLRSGRVLHKGDTLTIDGSTGEVMEGKVALIRSTSDADFQKVLDWADELRRLRVKANADTPDDARKARELGAEGIGLSRTEHMFFGPARIDVVREMILANDKAERLKSLEKLFVFQKEDMREIFSVMSGFPVTFRLLDPPLHEFLPSEPKDIAALAGRIGKDATLVANKIKALEEVNPMLGLRGCRLGLAFPEISEMQVRAVIHAALEAKAQGYDPRPEIMIPLVSVAKELEVASALVHATAGQVLEEKKAVLEYKVGTMLELPRACLNARSLAPMMEFASFGTNDLTQSTFGFSRDDIGGFLPRYLEEKILEKDPFATIDVEGVGQLMRVAVEGVRGAEGGDDKALGVCGEQGGDPKSVQFCEELGLNSVSCSPFRVPIARLAAAQAAILHKKAHK